MHPAPNKPPKNISLLNLLFNYKHIRKLVIHNEGLALQQITEN